MVVADGTLRALRHPNVITCLGITVSSAPMLIIEYSTLDNYTVQVL
jgi:hypothetical protein